MQTIIIRGGGTKLFGSILLAVMIGLIVRPAVASEAVQQGNQSNPGVASTSADGLPNAPSTLRYAASAFEPASGAADVRLEQQDHPPVTIKELPANMVHDGLNIVVSPRYIRANDLKWMLPLAGAAGVAFATDHRTMTQVVSSNAAFNQINVNMSNGLVGGFIAAPVAMFGVGQIRHDERARETGLLGSEAMVDAYVIDQVVKLCTFRERPNTDSGNGRFFVGSTGWDSSFVSAHSMLAWSSAAVIAGEYPSKWVKLGAYSLAAGVGVTRIMGQEHFPSDVLLGATGGWLIGHYVFRAHHHLPLDHRKK